MLCEQSHSHNVSKTHTTVASLLAMNADSQRMTSNSSWNICDPDLHNSRYSCAKDKTRVRVSYGATHTQVHRASKRLLSASPTVSSLLSGCPRFSHRTFRRNRVLATRSRSTRCPGRTKPETRREHRYHDGQLAKQQHGNPAARLLISWNMAHLSCDRSAIWPER